MCFDDCAAIFKDQIECMFLFSLYCISEANRVVGMCFFPLCVCVTLAVFSKFTKVHLLKTLLLNYHTHTLSITVQLPLVPNRTAENEGFGFSDAQSVSWYILLFPVLSKNISAAKGESEHILF